MVELPRGSMKDGEELANQIANEHKELVNAKIVDLIPVPS